MVWGGLIEDRRYEIGLAKGQEGRQQEARQLDKELLGGLLSRQLYGTRCASAQPAEAEAGSDALG